MFLQGWVNGILINESSVYGTLCIVLLKILNMGFYFREIDTRGWPYRRQDLLLPFNHYFAQILPLHQPIFWKIEGGLDPLSPPLDPPMLLIRESYCSIP